MPSGFYFVTLSRLRLIAGIGGIKKKNFLQPCQFKVLIITSLSLQGNYGCTCMTMKGLLTMLCIYHRTHSHKEVFHSLFSEQTDIIAESEDQRRAWSCLSGPCYSL